MPRLVQPLEQPHPTPVRCDGRLVRPQPPQDDSPSTACNSSTVSISTPGGVRLGAAEPSCFGQPPPGISQVPSTPPPPPPPPSSSVMSTATTPDVYLYPLKWNRLGAKPKTLPREPPSGSNSQSIGSGGGVTLTIQHCPFGFQDLYSRDVFWGS